MQSNVSSQAHHLHYPKNPKVAESRLHEGRGSDGDGSAVVMVMGVCVVMVMGVWW